MVGEKPTRIKKIGRSNALPLERVGTMLNPAPRLQFPWLPLDVNSLCSRFQVCFFPNKEEFGVAASGVISGNQSVRLLILVFY